MNKVHYTAIVTDYQDEVQAHKSHAKPRWQDGKFKPTAKAEAKLLKPTKRMRMAEAAREAAWNEMIYG